jgi:NAD(P)-dependent dehydrogenase (short-subunit alcohol dehydrogenase family)
VLAIRDKRRNGRRLARDCDETHPRETVPDSVTQPQSTFAGTRLPAEMNVLVAGAAGGIGAATVRKLQQDGHIVTAVDRDGIDITRAGGAEAAVAQAERGGPLDGVVHAVGMSGRSLGDGPPSACTDDGWAEVLRVNLESAFRLARAAFPAFRRAGGGSFVAVGSVLAEHADPDFLTVAYAVGKAGLRGLVRTAALEGAADGIRVNLVEPGLVDTPMARRAITDERIAGRLRELQPLGGEALPAEAVAEAVCWLLSPAASRTTGAHVPVDGGWTVR